jgi:hypothetical protein
MIRYVNILLFDNILSDNIFILGDNMLSWLRNQVSKLVWAMRVHPRTD